MSERISEDKVEEIRNRIDIVSLVGEYVTLKKAGRNFIGLCPFHREKTPSFTVNPVKQMFYCFGCAEGGNAVTFLMKMTNMSFPEALRYLAGKTGVTLPQREMGIEEKKKLSEREKLFRINKMAAGYFAAILLSNSGREARDYLKKRGMGAETAREFGLGYALDGWRHLRDFFESKKVPLKLVEQVGLIVEKAEDPGNYYDRFRGRLIFPIEDMGGRIIAFGGRIIGKGEPKYLNSPETALYIKGKNLYGLSKSKEAIRQQGYAVLVEGYMDLISLWHAGITNVVATLGTALTKDHVELIRRYTRHVVAVFDPDTAGQKALSRSMELFLGGDVNAKAAILPEGLDPDEYVRKYGKEGFEKVIADAQSLVDYYIENVIGKKDTWEDRKDALREAVTFIVHIIDDIERNLFVKRISEKLGIDQDLLKTEVRRVMAPVSSAPKVQVGRQKRPEDLESLELNLILLMLEYPHKIPLVVWENARDYFLNRDLKGVADQVSEIIAQRGIEAFDASMYVDGLDEGPLKKKLMSMMVEGSSCEEKLADRVLEDTIKQLRRKWYREMHKLLKSKIMDAQQKNDAKLCEILLVEKERLLREEKTNLSIA